MDIKTIIDNINTDNESIGNSAIYDKCRKSIYTKEEDEKEKVIDHLWGMIWLIGRSYAASPQRRSYGKSKHIKTYTDSDGKEKSRSIWPVRSENSGNGDFFKCMASYIVNGEIENKDDYERLGELIDKLKNTEYKFDIRLDAKNIEDEADVNTLKDVITAVSKFNRIVKRATEKFDLVDEYCENHAHTIPRKYIAEDSLSDIDYVYCKNQISFSSKFLHFFCPDTVFIIDQFSEKGGKFIFSNTKDKAGKYYISDDMVDESEDEDEEIDGVFWFDVDFLKEIEGYKKLKKALQKALAEKLGEEAELDKAEILNLKKNADEESSDKKSGDEESNKVNNGDWLIWGYLNHVINSYLLCLYINKCMKEALKNGSFKVKVSYPRLTDSVFMRTKERKKKGAKNENDTVLEELYYKK